MAVAEPVVLQGPAAVVTDAVPVTVIPTAAVARVRPGITVKATAMPAAAMQ